MDFFRDIFNSDKGKIIGAIIGIVIGIIILVFGFFKTIFIAFCALAGWHLGNAIDREESIKDILDKILKPGNR